MFGTLGGQEILFILVLALIVFGPRKLPEIGKSLGRMMAEFRKASNDFRRTLEEEVEAEKTRPAEPPAEALAEPPAEPATSPPASEPAADAPSETSSPDALTVSEPAEPTVARPDAPPPNEPR